MNAITSFKNTFLSNFAPCQIEMDGYVYPSVEHAYMAAKTLNPSAREQFRSPRLTAAQAKRLGKTVQLRSDWEQVKLEVMYSLLLKKFAINGFAVLLKATGDAPLVEGNNWGDRYWGICNGSGQNHLGKLLMKIRATL